MITLRSVNTRLQHLIIYIPGFLEDRAYFASRRGLEVNDHRAQSVTFPIPKELRTFQKLSTFKVVYPCSREVENWASLISTSLAETLFSSSNLEEVHIDVPCKDSDRSETLGDVSRQYVNMGGEPLKLRHLFLTEELMEFNVPLVPSLNDRLAGLAALVDLSRVESLAFHNAEEYHWQRPHVFYDRMLLYQAVTDHTYFCSLRRLNLPQLDGEMLRISNRVGMDASLPPYSLSELIFGCSLISGYRTGLRVRVQKRAYWPKTFAVGTKGYHDEPLVESICKWQGLERVSICLDLRTPRGRVSDSKGLVSISFLFIFIFLLFLTVLTNSSTPGLSPSYLDHSRTESP